jgi:hypothetical protein
MPALGPKVQIAARPTAKKRDACTIRGRRPVYFPVPGGCADAPGLS